MTTMPPMVRRANERGKTELGWLHSRHSFSFGDYYDPAHMGFRTLRVINDDIVEAGGGFGTHGHRDMEIISIVLSGALEHKDSLGHGAILKPGEVQVMTAGSGIRHSEFNPSESEPAHFLQIWIFPERQGISPAYGQKDFPRASRNNALQRVAGRDGIEADGALKIHQDANVYLASLEPSGAVSFDLQPGRGAWVHTATGKIEIGETQLTAGDAIAIEAPGAFHIRAAEGSEILIFDLL